MSVVVSNPQQILDNPHNSSPSKAMFSFGTEPRFQETYRQAFSNPNKNLCYSKNNSSLARKNGKFSTSGRPENIFIDQNTTR